MALPRLLLISGRHVHNRRYRPLRRALDVKLLAERKQLRNSRLALTGLLRCEVAIIAMISSYLAILDERDHVGLEDLSDDIARLVRQAAELLLQCRVGLVVESA